MYAKRTCPAAKKTAESATPAARHGPSNTRQTVARQGAYGNQSLWTHAQRPAGRTQYETAEDIYTTAIANNPTNVRLYSERARVYLQLERPDDCVRDCNRIFELGTAAERRVAHRLIRRAMDQMEKLRSRRCVLIRI